MEREGSQWRSEGSMSYKFGSSIDPGKLRFQTKTLEVGVRSLNYVSRNLILSPILESG